MKSNRRHSLSSQILFVLSLLVLCLGDDKFLIYTIKKCTFYAMDFRRTDVEYKVPLPPNLTGVAASAIRIRNRTFRLKGANLTSVYFSPGILSKPFRRRLLLISYNLGRNLSTSLYVSCVAAGYYLVSPIVGLLAYDGWDVTSSNSSELGLTVTGVHILIKFPAGKNRTVSYCARFGEGGQFSLEGKELDGRCSAKGPGNFGLVVRVPMAESPAAAPASPAVDRKKKRWMMWMVGVGGVGSMVLVFAVGICVRSLVRRRRLRKMCREADEGQVLDVMWIGGRKMPFAGLTRSVPVL